MADQSNAAIQEVGPECMDLSDTIGLRYTDGAAISELTRKVPDLGEVALRITSTTTPSGEILEQRIDPCTVDAALRCAGCVLRRSTGAEIEDALVATLSPQVSTIDQNTGDHL